MKVTNRRVNALEFVVLPKIEGTIKWIEAELDELDREDFYRLKCVQDKKKEAKDEEAAELKARKGGKDEDEEKEQEAPGDLLAAQDEWKDDDEEDVIF